ERKFEEFVGRFRLTVPFKQRGGSKEASLDRKYLPDHNLRIAQGHLQHRKHDIIILSRCMDHVMLDIDSDAQLRELTHEVRCRRHRMKGTKFIGRIYPQSATYAAGKS